MPIEFHCTGCRTTLRVGDDAAGKQAKCPQCGMVLHIPGTEPSAAGMTQAVPANPYQSSAGDFSAGASSAGGSGPFFDRRPISRGRLDAGDAFKRSWDLFINNMGGVFIAFLIVMAATMGVFVAVGFGILALVLILSTAGPELMLPGIVLGIVSITLPTLLLLSLLQYNLVRFYLALCRGEQPGFGMLLQYESNFWPFLGAMLGFHLLVGAGLMFCIVPGVFLWCWLFPWPYLVLERRMGIAEAFTWSGQLTEGNKGAVLLLMLILWGISFGAGMIPGGSILVAPLLLIAQVVCYLILTGQANRSPAAGTASVAAR